MKNRKNLMPLFFAGLVACSSVPESPVKGLEQGATAAVPTKSQIMNATFSGVFDQPFKFTNGVYEGPRFVEGGASRPRVQLWDELIAYGDLDGNAGDEAAVLISESSGGSGERVYVSAVAVTDDKLKELGTQLVGDRTKIRTFRMSDHQILMDVVEAGPQDPACCPTQLAQKAYALKNGRLQLVSSTVIGTLSVEALYGSEWTLVELNNHAIAEGLKAPTLSFQGNQIGGFGGCNRYQGTIQEIKPGSISVGPIAGTLMACLPREMQLEDRYVAQLLKAYQYTFLAGKLVLLCGEGDGQSLLKFVSKTPNSP